MSYDKESPLLKPRIGNIGVLVLMNVIWAAAYPATAIALHGMTALFLTMVRLGVGALMLIPFLWVGSRGRWSMKALWMALGLGIVGFSLPVYLQSMGLYLSSPAMAAMSIALEPLATAVIASLVLREALGRGRKWALAVAVIGAWAIAGFPTIGHLGYLRGDIVLLGAVLCFATYNVFSSRLVGILSAPTANTATLLAGFLGVLPIWLLLGGKAPRTWVHGELWALLYLAIMATAVAYYLWMFAVSKVSVALAALFLYLQPIIGVLLSVWLTNTALSNSFYIGSALIFLALYLGRDRSPAIA